MSGRLLVLILILSTIWSLWPVVLASSKPARRMKSIHISYSFGSSPLVSILSHLHQNPRQMPPSIIFIYSGRRGISGSLSSILFLDRLRELFAQKNILSSRSLELFYTGSNFPEPHFEEERNMTAMSQKFQVASMHPQKIWFRRLTEKDLLNAVGPADKRGGTVAYICGPPSMTDWAVAKLKGAEGMREQRVLCEKWW